MFKNIPRIGVAVVVMRDGKIVMGKRKGVHGSGNWSLPGGHLEFMESIEACAARELLEETGLKADSIILGPWTEDVMDQNKHYITIFVFATCSTGEPELLEPNKCEGWSWFDLDNLPTPLFQPIISLTKKEGIDCLKCEPEKMS